MASHEIYENQAAFILMVQIPTFLAMLLFVAARFFDRVYSHGRPMASDWLTIPASILVTACNAILVAGLSNGLSNHFWDIEPDEMVRDLKLTLAFRIVFATATPIIMVSICLAYMHLFPRSKVNIWFCRCMITYCACAGVLFIFLTSFACSPVSDFWVVLHQRRNCRHEETILMSAVIQKATSEVITFAWPIYFIWSLKLARNVRLSLSFLFSLGSVVSIIGLVKVWYVRYCYNHQDDLSWHAARLFLIETCELNLSLICACLPHVKRILKMLCCFRLHHRRDDESPQVKNAAAAAAAALQQPVTIDFAGLHHPEPIPLRNLPRRRPDPFSLSDFNSTAEPPPRSATIVSLESVGNASMPDAPRPHLRPSSPPSSPHAYRPRVMAPRVVSPPPDFDVTSTMNAIYRSGGLSRIAEGVPPPRQQVQTPRRQKGTPQKEGTPSLPRSPGSIDLCAAPPPPPPKYRGVKARGGDLDDDCE